MALSLSVACAGVNSNPSTLVRKNGISASRKTLTLVPITQNGTNKRNRRLSVHALQSQSDYYAMQQNMSSRSHDDGQSAKVFVDYSIYKGKAALTISPKAPEFSPIDAGVYKVAKEGCLFLQFAPAAGNRQFDWSRKQIFTLNVGEIGTLISLGPNDSCDFFHDPFLGKSEEGQVRKVLKAEPLPDGSGYFFNLSVSDRLKNVEENIYIPITKGEFAILRSCLDYLIPHLLGWNTFVNSISPGNSGRMNNYNSRPDLEWER
ncbi:single-stranded DNA-binding protein WHY1 [Carex littledalei]|uniref:Single-stranded DNA-binding protein WHY1 n=1 Tax=Carex littledalei TaxID=544730 RepID=A0A833VL71_9POAL|nr:single-stranded DNA-binding protein WHY1 [Carex littledalei]